MTVAQRIIQQSTELETLRALIDLAQNPQVITTAHETYRREFALTEAERAKAAEARQYIGQYDTLKAQMEKERALVEKAREDNRVKAEAENARLLTENQRLKEFSAQLDKRAAAISAAEAQVDTARRALATERAAVEKASADAHARVESDKEWVRKNTAVNQAEARRLAEYEQSLKAKAAKLRETAAEW